MLIAASRNTRRFRLSIKLDFVASALNSEDFKFKKAGKYAILVHYPCDNVHVCIDWWVCTKEVLGLFNQLILDEKGNALFPKSAYCELACSKAADRTKMRNTFDS